ncbi:MAG TPA: O-antigen ligase family protein [Edaphobacter sp.]|jgi:exopolysaccharide production protein ExoQ|nr:O-antigen ligase family protein [Edaphobacter sp.]
MDPSNDIIEENNFCAPPGLALAFAVGFFLSFRIVIPVFLVRMLGTDPQTGAETKLALNALLLGLVCFAGVGTANRTFRSMLQLASIRWVIIYLVFSGCSLLWSATTSVPASVAYWCGTVSDVAIVVLLLRAGPVTGVANSVMKGFIWSTCCIALIAWIMPTQYDLRLGDEDFFNSNSIGNLCAIAILFGQYLMRRKEGKWRFTAFFLSVTLLRSLSKTAIVAFLVSEGYLIIHDRSMSRKTKMFLTVAVITVIFIFWGLFEAYYDFYTTYGNQAETLTGRTAIWAYVFDAALEKPWIGHGFDSMWNVVPVFGTFEARHAENELLQQFYSFGVAGIVMLCGLYGSLYRKIRRLPQGPVKIIFVSILLFVIVRGFAVADPFDLLLPLWAIVLITMLVDCADTVGQDMATVLLPARSDASISVLHASALR